MLQSIAFGTTMLYSVRACTNILIPAGSSKDGSTILAYNNDFSEAHGALSHWARASHAPGELREIHDWDSGKYLGAIPEVPETYTVVGNTNEHQLTIGESTFGGLEMLDASDGRAVCNATFGCVDYSQVIWITLQRAKTAREAIAIADDLMQTYGYASNGESFSIADTQEVWVMEIMGKGNLSQGSVWVATQIPDGTVTAHANQARTREFRTNDPDHFLHSADVVSFARDFNLYHGSDDDFSFSDVYDPVTFDGARACEARVFSFFREVAAEEENIENYQDYAQGANLSNRMPLYVKVNHKIDVNETMWHMRNHYQGTSLDPTFDVGAGAWHSPYRFGRIGKYQGASYVNERSIGHATTAWNFVSEQRPHQKFSVLWFGVDDSTFTLRAPFYGVTTRVPAAWDDANCTSRDPCRESFKLPGTVRKFSFRSMWWVSNMIANYAYSRYDQIAPAAQSKIQEIQDRLFQEVRNQDAAIAAMNTAEAEKAASDFSYRAAEGLHEEWLDFYGELFATFVDGLKMVADPKNEACRCSKHGFGYDDFWKEEITSQAGDKYRVPESRTALATIPKHKLRSFRGSAQMCNEEMADSDQHIASLV